MLCFFVFCFFCFFFQLSVKLSGKLPQAEKDALTAQRDEVGVVKRSISQNRNRVYGIVESHRDKLFCIRSSLLFVSALAGDSDLYYAIC